jgi:hypothetical protein
MAITTPEQAKETVKKWLEENHHQINEITDDGSNFHFEIDYPLGSLKRQRVIQPKEYPGLMVILNGVGVAKEHLEQLKALTEAERDTFYATIRNDLLFLQNSYDMNIDNEGLAKQVQFSYEFYFDGLTKTKLFDGLLLNHRTLLYIITRFNDEFGTPEVTVQPEVGTDQPVGTA